MCYVFRGAGEAGDPLIIDGEGCPRHSTYVRLEKNSLEINRSSENSYKIHWKCSQFAGIPKYSRS